MEERSRVEDRARRQSERRNGHAPREEKEVTANLDEDVDSSSGRAARALPVALLWRVVIHFDNRVRISRPIGKLLQLHPTLRASDTEIDVADPDTNKVLDALDMAILAHPIYEAVREIFLSHGG